MTIRVTPTAEQMEYLASLGVASATPAARETRSNRDCGDDTASSKKPRHGLQIRSAVGLMGGLCGGGIGLFLGGFFGLITHGLPWGICIAFCTAIGWFMLGFLWSFGWRWDSDLSDSVEFSDAHFGIGVATGLAASAFAICFCGMLVAVMVWGQEASRGWVRGTLLVTWMAGLLPGAVLAGIRLVKAERL